MATNEVVLINPFETSPEDAGLRLSWRRAWKPLEAQRGFVRARLHRCLDPAARFGFVGVATWESHRAFHLALSPGAAALEAGSTVTAYSNLYRVVVSGGRESRPSEQHAVAIALFELEEDEWEECREFLKNAEHIEHAKGFISRALHRSLKPDAVFYYVWCSEWASAAVPARALQSLLANKPGCHWGLYEVAASYEQETNQAPKAGQQGHRPARPPRSKGAKEPAPGGHMSPRREKVQRQLARLFRGARMAKGWTQMRLTHEVFARTGLEVSTRQISSWDRGDTAPEAGFFGALIVALDLSTALRRAMQDSGSEENR
jgi:heme-degrading monooxygenase HmoA